MRVGIEKEVRESKTTKGAMMNIERERDNNQEPLERERERERGTEKRKKSERVTNKTDCI